MADPKDQKKPQEGQLKILSKPPTLAVDGNTVGLNDQNYGDLIFFQIAQKVENTIEVHGVASIRMTLDQFKALKGTLETVITEHEKKMAQKGQKAQGMAK